MLHLLVLPSLGNCERTVSAGLRLLRWCGIDFAIEIDTLLDIVSARGDGIDESTMHSTATHHHQVVADAAVDRDAATRRTDIISHTSIDDDTATGGDQVAGNLAVDFDVAVKGEQATRCR